MKANKLYLQVIACFLTSTFTLVGVASEDKESDLLLQPAKLIKLIAQTPLFSLQTYSLVYQEVDYSDCQKPPTMMTMRVARDLASGSVFNESFIPLESDADKTTTIHSTVTANGKSITFSQTFPSGVTLNSILKLPPNEVTPGGIYSAIVSSASPALDPLDSLRNDLFTGKSILETVEKYIKEVEVKRISEKGERILRIQGPYFEFDFSENNLNLLCVAYSGRVRQGEPFRKLQQINVDSYCNIDNVLMPQQVVIWGQFDGNASTQVNRLIANSSSVNESVAKFFIPIRFPNGTFVSDNIRGVSYDSSGYDQFNDSADSMLKRLDEIVTESKSGTHKSEGKQENGQ